MVAAGRANDLLQISSLLGYAPQHLFSVIGAAERSYFEIKIPRKSNPSNPRLISIPTSELRGVQKSVLSRILNGITPHTSSFAYQRGKSVAGAAQQLCGKNYLLKMDLVDFFPSITSRRVFGIFRKAGYSKASSYMLTKLTTYQGRLCQGAPTSPSISNLICRHMDAEFYSLATRGDYCTLDTAMICLFMGLTSLIGRGFWRFLTEYSLKMALLEIFLRRNFTLAVNNDLHSA